MSRQTDLVTGVLIAIIALALLFWIIPQNTSPAQSVGNLSPAFLPSVAVSAMLVLATLLVITSSLRSDSNSGELHEEFGEEARGIGLSEASDLLVWIVFATVLMAGCLYVGFLPSAIVALALAMLYAGERSFAAIAAVAIVVPVAVQQIALRAFTVQLP